MYRSKPEMLQRRGRVSYRALKRQFDFDDDYFEDLKDAIFCTPIPRLLMT